MTPTETIKKHGKAIFESVNEHPSLRWVTLLGTIILISVLLFPSLWRSTPKYFVGDVVKKDIKSPKDFLVEDEEATQKKRDEAARSVLTIYDFDDLLSSNLGERVTQAFKHIKDLSEAVQTDSIEPGADKSSDRKQKPGDGKPQSQTLSLRDLILKEKRNFEDMLGIEVSDGTYKILEQEDFHESISREIVSLLSAVLQNGIVGNKESLLQQQYKGITVRRLSSKIEVEVRDLHKFHTLNEAKTVLTNMGRNSLRELDRSLRNAIIGIAQHSVEPNLTLNKGETEERRNKAVAGVKAVLTQVKEGEMLVREGEKISPLHMVKLQTLESEMGKEQLFTTSAGFALLTIAFFVVFYTVNFKTEGSPTLKNKDVVFLCMMLIILFLLSDVSAYLVKGIARSIPYSIQASSAFYAIPVAAGAMTVCLFSGIQVALPFALGSAFVTAFLFEDRFEMFLFFLFSGTMGAYWVRNCQERGVLIKAGLKVGLVNVAVVSALHVFRGAGLELKPLWDWTFGILGGVSSGIFATGFAPVIEMTFGYTTDIKLLELANMDRPILRKLMLEASGTYHHSAIVGSLGEAAAVRIGANPLLARVSGYYHDIGKINKPLYFIENQIGRENRHDRLAPSMSSLILTAHVRDGVEMAKQHKLGQAIVDIIQQHHGSGLISYFLEKAKRLKGEDAVNVDHFRYPGPKPQTKEAGLVLLADVVEAASRALDNPTPARIKGLVKKIVNKTFLDGQLDECELTLKDLNRIEDSFYKILNGIHHHRIEYPNDEATVNGGTGKAYGDSDTRQAKSSQKFRQADKSAGKDYLKRLGGS